MKALTIKLGIGKFKKIGDFYRNDGYGDRNITILYLHLCEHILHTKMSLDDDAMRGGDHEVDFGHPVTISFSIDRLSDVMSFSIDHQSMFYTSVVNI